MFEVSFVNCGAKTKGPFLYYLGIFVLCEYDLNLSLPRKKYGKAFFKFEV